MNKKKLGAVLTVAAIALIGIVVLRPDSKQTASTMPTSTPTTEFTAIDTSFAKMMVAHHKQAVEMADIGIAKASSPDVKELASKIRAEQEPEIQRMTGWLQTWNEPVDIALSTDPGMAGHDMGADVPGMMTMEEMQKLQGATGTEFDKVFLEMMIKHHEGAIEMARQQVNTGKFTEGLELARDVVRTQESEVKTMRALLQ